jgi:hypothetical protein
MVRTYGLTHINLVVRDVEWHVNATSPRRSSRTRNAVRIKWRRAFSQLSKKLMSVQDRTPEPP